jgi:hypothetical protein
LYIHFLYEQAADSTTYFFDTHDNIRYFVKFTRATYLFQTICNVCQNIYEVSFEKESYDIKGFDFRIKQTIFNILKLFIEETRSPITYLCDSLDGREFCRVRLFEKWFSEYNSPDFQHDYRCIETENYSAIIGVISFAWDANFQEYLKNIEIYD